MKKFGMILLVAAAMVACGGNNAKQAEQDRLDSIAQAERALFVADSIAAAQQATLDSMAAVQQAAMDSMAAVAEEAKATAAKATATAKKAAKKVETTATEAKTLELKSVKVAPKLQKELKETTEAEKKANKMGFQKKEN